MKDCVWLEPKLLAQTEFPNGRLRDAAFAGCAPSSTRTMVSGSRAEVMRLLEALQIAHEAD